MDSILYWNGVALEANRVSHTNKKGEQAGPPLSARALAIVHLAMYDSYAGASGNPPDLPAYLPGLTLPVPGASKAAAVAAAAHAALSALFPSQKAFFDQMHHDAGLSEPGLVTGHKFGLEVAAAILKDRKDDAGVSDNGYAASIQSTAHRVDPDNPDQGYHAPFYGKNTRCFATAPRLGLLAPPQPGSPEYERALKQVRGKGIAPNLMGTLPSTYSRRTVDETLIGIYWGYDGAPGLGTPPRLYNQIVRQIAETKGNTEAENARLFALVNVAMADAGILAWEQKYLHDFWRPVLGIREHDQSMGPAGTQGNNIDNDCDPEWLPLGAPSTNALAGEATRSTETYPCQHVTVSKAKNFTPPFPAYPSGHATFGAAALHMVRLFYGVAPGHKGPDNVVAGMRFVSEECNGVNQDHRGTIRPKHYRDFPNGLWQMIEENGRSRVFLGVHWVFDAFAVDAGNHPVYAQNIGGVPLGINIAESIFNGAAGAGLKRAP